MNDPHQILPLLISFLFQGDQGLQGPPVSTQIHFLFPFILLFFNNIELNCARLHRAELKKKDLAVIAYFSHKRIQKGSRLLLRFKMQVENALKFLEASPKRGG